jgi:hypothetical protein
MQIAIELIEILAAILPAVLIVPLAFRRATRSGLWFIKVVGTSALSLVALGFLLMRLTTGCAPEQVTCSSSDALTGRIPGLFAACQMCESSRIAQLLNSLVVDIQAAAAMVCVLASTWTVITFLVWAKTLLRASKTPES